MANYPDIRIGNDIPMEWSFYYPSEEGSEERAAEHKHMNFAEAATLAKAAEVKELWLTHFSPALNRPDEFIDVARAIFPNTKTGTDGMSLTMKFEEE